MGPYQWQLEARACRRNFKTSAITLPVGTVLVVFGTAV